MKDIKSMSREELIAFRDDAQKRYDDYKSRGLKIDMSRGKPAPDQLKLSEALYSSVGADCYKSVDGTDCRNYGVLAGIKECRELFGELFDMPAENVIIGGTASLQLMFDFISQCYSKGIGSEPWCKLDKVKFIAVVPGYDRHFGIAEYFGIEMINVPMLSDGPDMDMIEELIKDESVKGMFCVPKYSNPDGITYSAEVCERLAKMKPAAADFRVVWDNAYCIHDLYAEGDYLPNIIKEAAKYGNEDNFVMFASTSKVTFPGAGISALCASDNNIKMILKRMNYQIISNDKMNQLRHCNVFKNLDDLKSHMKLHAAILRPKFETVLNILSSELDGLGIASWHSPRGGYFISLDVNVGSASYVGKLCKEAGLTLTTVGATFPYGKDPDDRNIRIAPSFPTVDDLKLCTELLCIGVKLAAAKEMLEGK